MKLSIGMIVKNEERYLDQCLKSLKPVLDKVKSELIIVDTGSSDRTVEIAKKYTNKVYYHPWANDFAKMRNITVGYAKGEWFCFFDADEVIEEPKAIIKFFKTDANKQYNAACVPISNILNEINGSVSIGYSLRFFKKDKNFCFEGIVHEQAKFRYPIYSIPTRVLHYGYLSTDSRLMEEKFQRNVGLLKTALEKEPDNIYHWFQLSQSYGMHKDRELSLTAITKAYELIIEQNESKEKFIYVLYHLAKTYFNNRLFDKCIAVSTEGLAINEKYIDFYYYKAGSFFEFKEYEKAQLHFKLYLKLLNEFKNNKGFIDLSVTHATLELHEKAYKALCVSSKMLNNFQAAIEYAQKIKSPLLFGEVISTLIEIIIEDKQISKLKELYDERIFGDSRLELIFVRYLEKKRKEMLPERQRELAENFMSLDSAYGLLNSVRNEYFKGNTEKFEEIYHEIKELEIDKLDSYYGDIFFYVIQHKYPLLPILTQTRDREIMKFFAYCLGNISKITPYLVEYLERYEEIYRENIPSSESLRIKVVLYRSLLLFGDLDDDEYKSFFKAYVQEGIKYINLIYSPDVISSEQVAWTRTGSDGFFLYMSLAKQYNTISPEYVRLMKKAVQQDKTMEKGVRLLVSEIENSYRHDKEELELHKKKIVQTIENCINTGDILTAKSLVSEYEKAVGADIKLESIKSVILMLEENYSEAETILKNALGHYGDNYDLIYNLIYTQEQMNVTVDDDLETRLDKVLGTRRSISPEYIESFFQVLNEGNIRYVVLDYLGSQCLSKDCTKGMHLLVHHEDKVKISRYFVPYDYPGSVSSVWAHTIGDVEEQLWGMKFPEITSNNLWARRKQNPDGVYFIDEETIKIISPDAHESNQDNFWCPEVLKLSFLRVIYKPVITIETFAYNAEKYIKQCIDSVVNQTFRDFEWVLLDNGSDDGTSAILLELAKNDYRIKLFRNVENTIVHNAQPNPSFMKHRNDLCSEYYTRIDSDDYIHKDFLKELYAKAKEFDADFAVGGSEAFYDSDPSQRVRLHEAFFNVDDIRQLGDILPKVYKSFRVYWNKLYRVSMVKQVWKYREENPVRIQNAGDTLFNFNCLQFATSAVGINKVLYYYRMRKDSLYHSQLDKDRYTDYLILYREAMELLRVWGKDTPQNLGFLAAVLYNSLMDCVAIAASAEKGSLEERKVVVTTILEHEEVRAILQRYGLWEGFSKQAQKSIDGFSRNM